MGVTGVQTCALPIYVPRADDPGVAERARLPGPVAALEHRHAGAPAGERMRDADPDGPSPDDHHVRVHDAQHDRWVASARVTGLRLADRPGVLAALERLLLESRQGFDHAAVGERKRTRP